jgi:hypothetical protein
MLPATILIVVGTDALTRAIAEGRIPWGLTSLAAGTALVLVLLVRFAGRRLRDKEKEV